MTVNQLTTISKIRKAFPTFFSKCQINAFKSIAYDSVKVTEAGTYFITSEIFKHERIGEHEVIHHEKDRVFKVRFANENDIYIIEKFDTLHRAKIYLDKLDHDTGGYRISQHEANQAKLRILGVK